MQISPCFLIPFPFRSPQSTECSLCHKQVLVSYLFYTQCYIYVSPSLSRPQSFKGPLWTIMFVFSVYLPCLTPVYNSYSVPEQKRFPLECFLAISYSPLPVFFIPHSLPKMVTFGHGLGCALSIYGSVFSSEFLSFVRCWREGGGSLTSCWLDGKRPLCSSGLQVDYLKYISYPCCWHISCILSF